MINASEKSAFAITTSKMLSNNTGGNATTDVPFLLDSVYFEPLRNNKLQYLDREKGALFKWIQVCMHRQESGWVILLI